MEWDPEERHKRPKTRQPYGFSTNGWKMSRVTTSAYGLD